MSLFERWQGLIAEPLQFVRGPSLGACFADELPDAVLMDIVMPGLNGFQATRQLTKDPETGHIPVIIITTKDQETDKIWGERQGAKDYLTKPVDEDTLIATLNKVLAG